MYCRLRRPARVCVSLRGWWRRGCGLSLSIKMLSGDDLGEAEDLTEIFHYQLKILAVHRSVPNHRRQRPASFGEMILSSAVGREHIVCEGETVAKCSLPVIAAISSTLR